MLLIPGMSQGCEALQGKHYTAQVSRPLQNGAAGLHSCEMEKEMQHICATHAQLPT